VRTQWLQPTCAFLPLLAALVSGSLAAQTTWQVSGAPATGYDFYCYDPVRDRTVYFDGGGTTWEYDGSVWMGIAAGSPRPGIPFSGVAYDRNRQRVVCHDGGDTWEWNGIAWTRAATWPPLWRFRHLIAHEGRGTVIAFGGSSLGMNDLYEWNGATWNLIPTTNRPPNTSTNPNGYVAYLSAAYDARRDKLVLFGRAFFDWSLSQYTNIQPDVWEWDATNGWVNRTLSGGVMYQRAHLFFDSQRGVLTSFTKYFNPLHVAEWDGGASWQAVTPITSITQPTLILGYSLTYEASRGQAFVTFVDVSSVIPHAYRTVNPARFEVIGAGCAGSVGEPTLRLTHNWTRAWLGRALSVDLAILPQSVGFVATGWSDQRAGAFTLPLPLDPFGMPGCFARVSTDAISLVAGSGGCATLSMQVPVDPSLVGAVFYQQGVSLDPGFNAAGLTVSNAVRVTIGSL
jgi:hypothetical protein